MQLRSLSNAATIEELDRIFADLGGPEVLISDHGPQFGSAEFRAFTKKIAITHHTARTEYPESNGMAERTIQTAKNILRKVISDGKSLNDALQVRTIRSTPVDSGLPSPTVLLQSRNIHGNLPFTSEALQYRPLDGDKLRDALKQRQSDAVFNKKGTTKAPFQALQVNQRVRIRVGKRWLLVGKGFLERIYVLRENSDVED